MALAPKPANTQVPGILIEGSDYAGKSTVARLLAEQLQEGGAVFETGKCYLTRNPVVAFLDDEARRHDDLLVRDKYYSAAIMCDLEAAKMFPPKCFRIQERHWLSQLGRNLFFHPDIPLIPDGYLEQRHLTFTIQILLYSDVASKNRRVGSRPPASPRDRLLLGDPALHQAYDDFIKSLLPPTEEWLILDISDASPKEVTVRILQQTGLAEQVLAVG